MHHVPDGPADRPKATPAGRSRIGVIAVFGFAVAASAVLTWASRDAYAFMFGPVNLLLLTTITAALGAIALWLLVRFGWFHAAADWRSILLALGLGCCLTLPMMIVDVVGGFPAEMNVRFPESLLFYPALAVVAESVFHLVPLALLASVWKVTRFEVHRTRMFAIGAVALIEPAFQVSFFAGQPSMGTSVFLGLYVLAFNLISLEIFRRSGFLALYALRLGYYLIWHIAWGHLRLPLLFGSET